VTALVIASIRGQRKLPLYDFYCDCGNEIERVIGSYEPNPICSCGKEMRKKVGSNIMVKMKGEGGYPSRRKQVFNTTYRKHPNLD
jgi:predicted nucleic acid-binding Zn ribbon protein